MRFLLLFLVYALINAYIFRKAWRVLSSSRMLSAAKRIYGLVFFFFFSAFVFAMLGRNVLPLGVQKAFYFPGTVWLGAVFYLLLWFLITDAAVFLLRLFFPSVMKRAARSPLLLRMQVGIGYMAVVALLSVGYSRFTHPAVVEKNLSIEKSGGKYQNLKIVALSDLHLGVAIDKRRLQSYVQLVNAQRPDLILIGGDLVDNNLFPLNQENMQEEINQLQAPLGVYMCLGNHEYLSGIAASLEFLKKTKIQLLVDRAELVDGSFWIVGRDDVHGNPNRQALSDLLAPTNAAQALLLIDHEPWTPYETVAGRNIDLQFFGHTHHGQIWPLNSLVKRFFPLAYGYRKHGATHTWVSSGLGLWGPPFRIGTQSEIVVFHLNFKE